MDPVAAGAAFYGVETAVEAGVAAYFLTQPTLPLKARLQHIASPSPLPRSSHSLGVIGDKAYLFGGHFQNSSKGSQGQAAPNDIHELQISTIDNTTTANLRSISATSEDENGAMPQGRVDHTAVTARNRIFIFGGRNSSSATSQPIDENGRIWVFHPLETKWTFLESPPHTQFPCARYQHACTVDEDGNAIFVHAGIAVDGGERLSDTWAFYLNEGKWTKLADTSGPGRSGASLACSGKIGKGGKLWRFGGWDGEKMMGRLESLQLLSPKEYDIKQAGTLDESKREWEVVEIFSAAPESVTNKAGKESKTQSPAMPEARSMAALHFTTTGNGRDYLILALGEGNPPHPESGSGERALLQDIWAYQLPSSGFSLAGVKDAVRQRVPGISSHEGQWAPVEVTGMEIGEDEEKGGSWTGRSCFASSMTGTKQFMLWGGVNLRNEVLGDGWLVKIN